MTKYVMVTGPAAVGKSTLCGQLRDELPAFFYKPVKAYFDLAREYNISVYEMFNKISAEEAITYFCNVCKYHDIVVGDQHLAIQPQKDSALALNKVFDREFNEPFVSAIDYMLFDKMDELGIKTLVVYLKAHPEILFERAFKRNIETGFPIRNKCLQDVVDEVAAEEYYFQELIRKKKVDNIIIDTTNNNVNNMCYELKRKILKKN